MVPINYSLHANGERLALLAVVAGQRASKLRDGGRAWYVVPIGNFSPKHKYAWSTSISCD